MIFCFSAFCAAIVYALFIEYSPVLTWHLVGAIAILGGIWEGYDKRVNG